MKKVMLLTLVCLGLTGSLMAQRGYNRNRMNNNGQAQQMQQAKPEVVAISGTIQEVVKGPCEKPKDGKAMGSFLVVKGNNGQVVRLHLGPACIVNDMITDLQNGQSIQAKVFQPGDFRDQDYLVQTIETNQGALDFHDQNLVPIWASQQQEPMPRQPQGPMPRR